MQQCLPSPRRIARRRGGGGERRRLGRWSKTYSSRGGLLVAGLASHLEGNAIGGGVLELKGGGGQVVEVLVEEL